MRRWSWIGIPAVVFCLACGHEPEAPAAEPPSGSGDLEEVPAAEQPPPPGPAPAPAERLVRVDAAVTVADPRDCGGGPGFRTACPARNIRVALFQRDGQWRRGRVMMPNAEPSIADAEAAAEPIAAEQIAQMERVIAGVELLPTAAPHPGCPHLVVETTARRGEAGGCIDGDGMRAPDDPAPSRSRYEAVYRLLRLLRTEAEGAPGLGGSLPL